METSSSIRERKPGKSTLTFLFNRYRSPVAVGIVFAYLFYFLLINPHPGFPKSMDFTSWLAAGKMVVSGQANAIYDLAEQARYQKPLMFPFETPGGILVYNRPPFFVYPFIPLSLLPFTLSYILWAVLMVAAGGAAIWIIVNKVRPMDNANRKTLFEWSIYSLAFFPVFQGILLGQTSLLELLILASIYLLLRQKKDTWAGVVMALGAFKPQLLIFLVPILIFRRSWRGLISFSIMGLVLGLLSVLLVGVQGIFDFIKVTGMVYDWNCTNGVYPELHQSWRGLLIGLIAPPCSSLINDSASQSLYHLADQYSNYLNIITILVVFLAWIRIWKLPEASPQFDQVFALTVLASLLASPYSNPQELTRLVLFVALLFRLHRLHPNALPGWFNIPILIVVAILISPLVMTPAARSLHPFVWLQAIVFLGLVIIIFSRNFLTIPQEDEAS